MSNMMPDATTPGTAGAPAAPRAQVSSQTIEAAGGEVYPIQEPRIFIEKSEPSIRRPKVSGAPKDITMTLSEWNQYWNDLSKDERKKYIDLFKIFYGLPDDPSPIDIKRVWENFGEFASQAYNNGAGISINNQPNRLLNPLELLEYEVSVAYEQGLVPEEREERLVKQLTPEAELESTRTIAENDIRNFASRNGIGLGEDYINSIVDDIVNGNDTLDNVKSYLRENFVANAYPTFSDQILQGKDVYDLASPYIAKMASVLELNQYDITLDDPMIQKAIIGVDPDGKPTTKPLWMFEQELKQLPEYQYTNRGQQDAYDLANILAKGFGLL